MKKDYTHNYIGVLLEDMNSKFDRMVEVLAGVVETQHIHTQKLGRLEEDVTVIKSVVITHSADLKNHETRIKTLETKAF